MCRLIRPRSSTIQAPSAGCALELAQQLEHRGGLELVLLSAAGEFSQRAVDADEWHGPILRLRAVLTHRRPKDNVGAPQGGRGQGALGAGGT
jgi:hypothetical protein